MFSAQEHFNFQEPSSEDEQVRNRKKKHRTKHSHDKLDTDQSVAVEKELEHNHSKHKDDNINQYQPISTAETFHSHPSSIASSSSPAMIEEKQPSEDPKLDFKIHVNPYNSVLTPEEIKNLTIEDARYYKILGESRMFHSRPGLHSQKIKEIEQLQKEKAEKDNNRLKNQQLQEIAQKKQQLKQQSKDQGEGAEQPTGNENNMGDEGDFSDLFAVDLQNRYFTSEEKMQVQCRRCKQSGHFERMCVMDIKNLCTCCLGDHPAYACTQRVCFNCNNSGHYNKNCPFQKFTRCARCQKLGHHKADCGAILINNASNYSGSANSYSGNNWPKNFKTIEEDWKKYDDQKIKCISCGKKGHITCKDYGKEKIRDEVYGRQFQEKMRKHREKEENKKFEENRKQMFQGQIVNFVYDETEDEENDKEDKKEVEVQEISKSTKKLKKLKDKKKEKEEQKEVMRDLEEEENESQKVIVEENGEEESVKKRKKAGKKIELKKQEEEEEEEEDIQIHVVKKEKELPKKKEKKIKKAKEDKQNKDLDIEEIDEGGKKKKLNRKQRREQLQLAARNYVKSNGIKEDHEEDCLDDDDDDIDLDTMLARNMLQKKIIKNRHLEQENEYEDQYHNKDADSDDNQHEDIGYLLDGESRSGYGSDICLSEVESEDGKTHKNMYSQHDRGSKLKFKKLQEKQNAQKEAASRSRSRSKNNHKNVVSNQKETKNNMNYLNKKKPQPANENNTNTHYLRHPIVARDDNDHNRYQRENNFKNKQNHSRSQSQSSPHISKDRNIFNQQANKPSKYTKNPRNNSKNRKNNAPIEKQTNNDRYFSFEKHQNINNGNKNQGTLRSRPKAKK